mmetsp:Transcript_8881/g.25422  ORF Transcript_8881/g.25422 Transcript_8881/m.25422 type:complete len:255 (+) Transcript_8881:1-765(+)
MLLFQARRRGQGREETARRRRRRRGGLRRRPRRREVQVNGRASRLGEPVYRGLEGAGPERGVGRALPAHRRDRPGPVRLAAHPAEAGGGQRGGEGDSLQGRLGEDAAADDRRLRQLRHSEVFRAWHCRAAPNLGGAARGAGVPVVFAHVWLQGGAKGPGFSAYRAAGPVDRGVEGYGPDLHRGPAWQPRDPEVHRATPNRPHRFHRRLIPGADKSHGQALLWLSCYPAAHRILRLVADLVAVGRGSSILPRAGY